MASGQPSLPIKNNEANLARLSKKTKSPLLQLLMFLPLVGMKELLMTITNQMFMFASNWELTSRMVRFIDHTFP